MLDYVLDFAKLSYNKYTESICGDFYYKETTEDGTTVVLSDGLGSGVKANILATLTSQILGTLLSGGMILEDAIFTTVQTLPICRERKLAYATFVAARIQKYKVYLTQFDNPPAILLRGGKYVKHEATRFFIQEKEIWESTIPLYFDDMLFLMTDGVTNAGLDSGFGEGLGHDEVVRLLEQWYRSGVSAALLGARLMNACLSLYDGKPKDDTTILTLQLRERKAVNIIIGPPENPAEDHKILNMFFGKKGKHVVCGGSTANMVAKFLKRPIISIDNTSSESIPAMSKIEGVDLVTEGIITLRNIPKLIREYEENAIILLELEKRKDGVAMLARMLIEDATDINIYLGNAVNDSHQDGESGIDMVSKLKLVQNIGENLEKIGKKVKISMC
ncbi:serine/threonine-protein phosphatase [Tissierella pigra]|uniref:SpoIIE family protein phosphatase n=1 Tax=Tissierella pigra TaxID=2607614 RepID=A0A6N7Y0Q2_9FIRM|nr:SpoIIE family protein phosphatase [Tissierella pigra]MBU5428272.1 serine/threonine-protein phosphatase [Tissierella pigra]MSU02434.1 SpoIIE family protein phosphatase [Tissierella pigra]